MPDETPATIIDASRSDYRPVTASFRGVDYVFGQSALGIYRALNAGAGLEIKEGESKSAYAVRLLESLPELVTVLCPSFPAGPWGVDEELALFGVVTEVLKRSGDIRFQAE